MTASISAFATALITWLHHTTHWWSALTPRAVGTSPASTSNPNRASTTPTTDACDASTCLSRSPPATEASATWRSEASPRAAAWPTRHASFIRACVLAAPFVVVAARVLSGDASVTSEKASGGALFFSTRNRASSSAPRATSPPMLWPKIATCVGTLEIRPV